MSTGAKNRVTAGLASIAVLTIVAAVAVVAAPALADGNYGADTCLNGYVWREAVPADHVCVTGQVRTQTAQENSLAAARRSPTGGPYGPDTCLQGYVWREAFAGDHVCVYPSSRDQARNDNLNAALRRDDLRVFLGSWNPQTTSCDGSVCTSTSDNAARYRVVVDRINVGPARVVLVRMSNGSVAKSWSVSVPPNPQAPGGLLSLNADALRCGAGAPNAYFLVLDRASGRWSSRVYVRTFCATL